MIKNFKNLNIWKRSRILVREIYLQTENFPVEEKFGLVAQLRRASVSVPSNIAEGCGRNHVKELIQHLYIASGSLCEIETQLYLSIDLELCLEKEIRPILEEVIEVRKMIAGFIKSQQ